MNGKTVSMPVLLLNSFPLLLADVGLIEIVFDDGTIIVCDLRDGLCYNTAARILSGRPRNCTFTPNQKVLICTSESSFIEIIDPRTLAVCN